MTQKLCRRLEGLEKISAAAAARVKERSVDPQRLEEFWDKVRAWHAVPENQAWVAAQPPEWLGIQLRRTRAQLAARAEGRPLPVWSEV